MHLDIKSLNERRIKDLEIIYTIREKKGFLWTQSMKIEFLFIYSVHLSHLDKEEAISKFLDMQIKINSNSNRFIKDMITKNIPYYCKCYAINNKNKLSYKNSTIIENLKISKAEIRHLNCIIDDEERKRRNELYLDKIAREKRLEEEIIKSSKKFNKDISLKKSIFEYQDEVLNIIEEL